MLWLATAIVVLSVIVVARWLRRSVIVIVSEWLEAYGEGLGANAGYDDDSAVEGERQRSAQIGSQIDALAEALSRIRGVGDFAWLDRNYKVISKLLRLRARDLPEQEIAKRMDGVALACPGEHDGVLTIWEFSEYYVATHGVDFEKAEKACRERLETLRKSDPDRFVLAPWWWGPEMEPPATPRRKMHDLFADDDDA